MKYALTTAALLLGSVALAFPSQAQEREPLKGWQVSVGAGVLTSPTYEGDDDYDLKVLPNLQFRYGERFFASVQEGVGYRLFNSETFSAGPIAKIRFSRDEDGDQTFSVTGGETDDLRGLGDIDTTIEAGGFAEWTVGDITLSGEVRQGIGGHEGLVADLGASYGGRLTGFGPPVFWSAGPNIRLADSDYTSAYFGVTPLQSARSGLPQYEADGGLYSYGLSASAFVPLDRDNRWSLVMIAGYDQLAGDAGDAPLVDLRGSRDQFTFGAFLSRTFQ
ncbi:MipA/OmpV family protein [Henriciella mobilis]|uniref:MipA/OmpV family protein n=1 Tax=Henriciella mobilis TaxID=2305467 RepID=A0A399RB37_9PROT|nr:MipA/OmpV family protein [Henriciella mobilis]RIJ14805.1 MipA/OmpV family protein [Henriciella mobilis]RIJ21761.1 MipA/OmpV family protein [Henriciella mobilis]RIJ26739.1 MipA/OmpV family protein [Henriciella mobilis]